jgi:hypothetical protein
MADWSSRTEPGLKSGGSREFGKGRRSNLGRKIGFNFGLLFISWIEALPSFVHAHRRL